MFGQFLPNKNKMLQCLTQFGRSRFGPTKQGPKQGYSAGYYWYFYRGKKKLAAPSPKQSSVVHAGS
jgi:hypothetical protein